MTAYLDQHLYRVSKLQIQNVLGLTARADEISLYRREGSNPFSCEYACSTASVIDITLLQLQKLTQHTPPLGGLDCPRQIPLGDV
jgi:hypothetical protein